MNVMDAIRTRRSVRAYAATPIPTDVFKRMQAALRWAPSACNNQPWHFVLVSDAELRRQVAQAAREQTWMAQAPVIIVGCGLPSAAYKKMGGAGNSVDVDLAIAMDHLTLAAVAEGLGTCWIGAFDEQAVKTLLGIPPSVKVVALTPLGYPARADLNRPSPESRRKKLSEIFSTDTYGGLS